MTQQTPVATIQARKRPALIGGLVGLVAVLAILGYLGYGIVTTPSKPALATAPQREVVDYISNARGLAGLPRIEQEKFLEQWKQSLIGDEGKKIELKKCFDAMNDVERSNFTDGVFDHMKRKFVDDAQTYARTASTERYKYLRERFQAYTSEAMFVKDVGNAFKGSAILGYDEQQKWILQHTTPEERAICEPYVQALQDTRDQVKKEQRPVASQPASAPG